MENSFSRFYYSIVMQSRKSIMIIDFLLGAEKFNLATTLKLYESQVLKTKKLRVNSHFSFWMCNSLTNVSLKNENTKFSPQV